MKVEISFYTYDQPYHPEERVFEVEDGLTFPEAKAKAVQQLYADRGAEISGVAPGGSIVDEG